MLTEKQLERKIEASERRVEQLKSKLEKLGDPMDLMLPGRRRYDVAISKERKRQSRLLEQLRKVHSAKIAQAAKLGRWDRSTGAYGHIKGERGYNPRQPSRRVGRALKKYVKGQLALPKKWTPAQVKVDDRGGVQVKINPAKMRHVPNAPSKRPKANKRKRAAKRNPVRTFDVKVPATSSDSGYKLKIRAESASGALAEARRYCAKRQGKELSKFRLPRGAKARAA